jgi:hypothetical protein
MLCLYVAHVNDLSYCSWTLVQKDMVESHHTLVYALSVPFLGHLMPLFKVELLATFP